MLVVQRRPTHVRPAVRGSQITCTTKEGTEIVITLLPRNRIGVTAPKDVLIVRDDAGQRERG